MKKKLIIFCSVFLLILASIAGFLFFNDSIIINKFKDYIEESTGTPLIAEVEPKLVLFPSRGLELHKSMWTNKSESIRVNFNKAMFFISSRYLFLGKIKIKNITIDGLNVEMTPPKNLLISPDKMNTEEINQTSRYILEYLVKLFRIVPNEINITNANIKIIYPNQRTLNINNLTIDAYNVQPDTDTSIKLSMNLAVDPFKTLTSINANLIARLSHDKFSVNIQPLQFMQDNKGKIIKRDLSGKIEADLADHKIAFQNLSLQGGNSEFSISGTSDSMEKLFKIPLNSNSNFKIHINGTPEKITELFNMPKDYHVLILPQPVNFEGNIILNSGNLHLLNFDFHSGPLISKGNLLFKSSNMHLEGDVDAKTFNLEKIIELLNNEDKVKSLAEKSISNVSINLRINRLTFKNLDIDNFQVKIVGGKGMYTYNPIRCSFAGSDLLASAALQFLTFSPISIKTELTVSIPKLDLSKLPTALTGDQRYTGILSLNANLSYHNQKRLKSLQGTGTISASDFTSSFDLAANKLFEYTPVKHFNALSKCSAAFSIQDGIITASKLGIRSPSFNFVGNGVLNLLDTHLQLKGTLNLPDNSAYTIEIIDDISKRTKKNEK